MYLRYSTRKKNGKVHTSWRVVQCFRVGKKVLQRTLVVLGELDEEGRARARALADRLSFGHPQPGLFDDPEEVVEPVAVYPDKVRLERSRSFGIPWVGHELWRALKLDDLLSRLLPCGREDVPWERMVEILVLARLAEPSSELHVAESWYRTTALEDLLGIGAEKVNDDRLYRVLDRVLPHKEAIEKHLKARLGDLFEIPYDLLLYDLTSTYFEGTAAANPDARFGHSSDRRSDCRQVCVALVVTREGLPFGYEVFAGNRTGVVTVREIVTTMEARYGRAERIWVMDRGMVSEANLAWMREGQRQYLVGAHRSGLKRFRRELGETQGWVQVREGLEAKVCTLPAGGESYVLCRSQDRREKEREIRERFSRRIEERLAKLEARLAKARSPVDRDRVSQQVGRILGQNTRAASRYKIRVEEAPDRPGGLRVHLTKKSSWGRWANLTEGIYALRTNLDAARWDPGELWLTYTQLTEAEAAFRTKKSDLALRPIWHHKSHRVKAHILICFLAYVLWKMLEQWQVWAGLGREPRKILAEFGRLQSTDVVLPLVNGKDLRLRCVVNPEPALKILLDHLGLTVPKRLRPPRIPEM